MKKVIIIGANSAIATAIARRYATEGAWLHLLARDGAALSILCDDLCVRGATKVTHQTFDATDLQAHPERIAQAFETLEGEADIALIAYGSLGDQKLCERDVNAMLASLNINATSVLSLMTLIANQLEKQKHGTLAVIGSVAGDRGRASNYVYGTAKGAVHLFAQGLRNRLSKVGISVLTIKPGFVDTPMTKDFKKGPLWATPERVAKDIVNAINRKRDVIYTPFFWWFIMAIIKAIPERIFKRLSL